MTIPQPDQGGEARASCDLPLQITGHAYEMLPAEQIDLDGRNEINAALDQIVATRPASDERAAGLSDLLARLMPGDSHHRLALDLKAELFTVEDVMTALLAWVLAAYQADQLTVYVAISTGMGQPWDQGREPVQPPALPQRSRRPQGGHLDFLYAEIRIRAPAIALCVIRPEGDEPAYLRLTYRNWNGRVGLTDDKAAFCWLTGPKSGEVIAPIEQVAGAAVAIAEELHAPVTAP
jgi:hypothetical protein